MAIIGDRPGPVHRPTLAFDAINTGHFLCCIHGPENSAGVAVVHTDPTIKAIGHQWFWEYDYVDDGINFESFIVQEEDLQEGQPRLLTTDTRVVLPVDTIISLLVTSSPDDVIHAWTIPAFGVKVDAIPGRLNERWFRVKPGFEGRYYGQCSELCGPDHAYMPIMVDIVSKEEYAAWIASGGDMATLDTPEADITVAMQTPDAR